MPGKITSRDEWLVARKELLVKEKEATRVKDELNKLRAALPMVQLDKKYTFTDLSHQKRELKDLFEGRKQLLVYHFMFAPTDEKVCSGCTFLTNDIPKSLAQLNGRSTTLALISRAPIEKIAEVRKQKGWEHVPWYSSFESDFNYDFQVSIDADHNVYNYKEGKVGEEGGERPGISVFLRGEDEDEGSVYHTYSTYQRGVEGVLPTYGFLDLGSLGRLD